MNRLIKSIVRKIDENEDYWGKRDFETLVGTSTTYHPVLKSKQNLDPFGVKKERKRYL